MPLLISFLILLLNLVILGVVYWGIKEIVGKVIPSTWLPDPAKQVLLTVVKVIVVVIAAVWIVSWLIAVLGGGGFAVPMFYHRH
jgi:hypothetical protein